MSMVVGITGGIGSGKSSVTDRLQNSNIDVVDADVIARKIVEPDGIALRKIAARFGNQILLPDGQLDRAKLRKIVFTEKDEKLWLENLTHPLIEEEIRTLLSLTKSVYAVLSSALLLESKQKVFTDLIIVVDTSEVLQIQRTMKRDKNDEKLVKKIIRAQMPRKKRLSKADIVLENDGTLKDLWKKTDNLHKKLITLANRGYKNKVY